MSEPIQSISQGNYILQGTVATSAGIVGDGSTQNPLRADETVLFSGSSSGQAAADVTLSENATKFEKLTILYKDRYTTSIGSLEIYTAFMTFDNTSQSQFSINCTFAAANIMYSRTSHFKFSNNTTITLQTTTQAQFKTDGTFAMGTGSGASYPGPFIYKVVGINRQE